MNRLEFPPSSHNRYYSFYFIWKITPYNIFLIGKETLELITSFKERSSLAYGADWRPRLDERTICSSIDRIHLNEPLNDIYKEGSYSEKQELVATKEVIATCSFYDHALHLWTVTL